MAMHVQSTTAFRGERGGGEISRLTFLGVCGGAGGAGQGRGGGTGGARLIGSCIAGRKNHDGTRHDSRAVPRAGSAVTNCDGLLRCGMREQRPARGSAVCNLHCRVRGRRCDRRLAATLPSTDGWREGGRARAPAAPATSGGGQGDTKKKTRSTVRHHPPLRMRICHVDVCEARDCCSVPPSRLFSTLPRPLVPPFLRSFRHSFLAELCAERLAAAFVQWFVAETELTGARRGRRTGSQARTGRSNWRWWSDPSPSPVPSPTPTPHTTQPSRTPFVLLPGCGEYQLYSSLCVGGGGGEGGRGGEGRGGE